MVAFNIASVASHMQGVRVAELSALAIGVESIMLAPAIRRCMPKPRTRLRIGVFWYTTCTYYPTIVHFGYTTIVATRNQNHNSVCGDTNPTPSPILVKYAVQLTGLYLLPATRVSANAAV